MLNGQAIAKRVALLIEQNVEDSEFQIPYNALQKAGANVVVLGSRMNEEYRGKQGNIAIKADATTTEVLAKEFDAVIIPGGMAPDVMRTNRNTVRFVKDAIAQGKWVAAICHGPQLLIEGDLVRGKRVTGFKAIRRDLENAGATVFDEPLIVDGNLITARRPGDLPIFTTAILKRLGLSVPDTTLPNETDGDASWWKLGEEWGGSTRSEIVQGLNTAIAVERYGLEAFEHYAENAADEEMSRVFFAIRTTRQRHLTLLENRLAVLGEKQSFQAAASGAYAHLKTWLQFSWGDANILRRALGDLQTGVIDIYKLRNRLTDPVTVAIFDEMEIALASEEPQVANLYHTRLVAETIEPPQPTSRPAVLA
ncbi:DJ-1/PfpI/YhbO family deglycase/protease [Stenomitos frigidus]|uniref:Type 1 glutamine amidotransferase n=1 Tax=Stenomitos frigidus ULC18 TaxID=2107698 RepID=A0A2T1E0S2_9CYAN|nr:DJ-1/PfpI/YhbO family deglycase/protease [Stenomitos frigidus]PSB26224.1 type 1 glutamine amidotransferase [Stenomitos frigidus ULC18]